MTRSRLAIGPSFIVRKHWRDTLTRLTEFLRLLDYLILELLRRLVKSAVRDLLMHLRRSYFVEFELNNGGEMEDDEDLQFHPKSLLKRSGVEPSSCSDRRHSLLVLRSLRANPNDFSDHQEKSTLKSDDLHRDDLYPSKDALDLPHVRSRTTNHRATHDVSFTDPTKRSGAVTNVRSHRLAQDHSDTEKVHTRTGRGIPHGTVRTFTCSSQWDDACLLAAMP